MFKKELPYIIAEVGSNHLGNEELAKKSIILAKKAGADCVKFQLFDENNLVSKKLKIYKHVKDNKLKYQYERFKKVKLTVSSLKKLSKLAKSLKIDISVSPFDVEYVSQVKNYINFFKIASGDINNFDLLKEVSKTKKKVIISTGMSSLLEIKKAINFFPRKNIILLHCISCYPTDNKDANLINISYLNNIFNIPTGYSDHVPGIEAAANSVFFGAKVIEKHFMPKNTKMAGDYKLSVDYKGLEKLVKLVKINFNLIGKKRSKEFKCEKYSKRTLRRSVYFKKNINKSVRLTKKDLILLRPYNNKGVPIEKYYSVIGKRLRKKVKESQLVTKSIFF